MLLSIQESRQLIKKLQEDIASTADQRKLLNELELRYRPHKKDNYLYDTDEIKQDYLFASWNALYRAKLNVGDPIAFAINRGRGAMLDYYRKVSSQCLLLICDDCGEAMTYDRRNTKCKSCKCVNLTSVEKVKFVEGDTFNVASKEDISAECEKEELFEMILSCIELSEELIEYDKQLAIDAIKNRMDFADYAKSIGKPPNFANKFKERVLSYLSPLKSLQAEPAI